MPKPSVEVERAEVWSNSDGDVFVTLTTFASTLEATSLWCRCLERRRRYSGALFDLLEAEGRSRWDAEDVWN